MKIFEKLNVTKTVKLDIDREKLKFKLSKRIAESRNQNKSTLGKLTSYVMEPVDYSAFILNNYHFEITKVRSSISLGAFPAKIYMELKEDGDGTKTVIESKLECYDSNFKYLFYFLFFCNTIFLIFILALNLRPSSLFWNAVLVIFTFVAFSTSILFRKIALSDYYMEIINEMKLWK